MKDRLTMNGKQVLVSIRDLAVAVYFQKLLDDKYSISHDH